VTRFVIVVAALGIAVHGLIHLLGTTAYLQLAVMEDLPYKTTVLGGRLDLGPIGIRVFAVLWILPAIAFVAAALALLEGWHWWEATLLAATLASTALTVLDWNVACRGALVDFVILTAYVIRLQMAPS
jgi:hypothetical protein